MALKRTEIKRSRIEHKNKKNLIKKAKRDTRKLSQLANLTEYQLACAKVDKRDGGNCQECGDKYGIEHHHARFRSAGGKNDVENLLLLCGLCHRINPNAPHQSREGRIKWVEYLTAMYPDYWRNSRKSQEITPRYKEVAK